MKQWGFLLVNKKPATVVSESICKFSNTIFPKEIEKNADTNIFSLLLPKIWNKQFPSISSVFFLFSYPLHPTTSSFSNSFKWLKQILKLCYT